MQKHLLQAHYKYNFTSKSAFRLSAGRGFRTANPIIENTGQALVNSRNILIKDIDLNIILDLPDEEVLELYSKFNREF